MEDYNGLKELERLNLELAKGYWEEYHKQMGECQKYLREYQEDMGKVREGIRELSEYFGIEKEK